MRQPNVRKSQLTEQQVQELNESGETQATLQKAPWYYPLMEHSAKFLLAACAGMALYIFNGITASQEEQTKATKEVAAAFNDLQRESVRLRTQLEAMTESMRALSTRQDAAIATAERALNEQSNLSRRVELLQYYLLELDAKAIAAGIKPASQAISTQMLKESKK